MENKEQDRASEPPAEDNRDKHVNYFAEDAGEDVESSKRRHDAGGVNDESYNEMLEIENQVDPGNEHHHHADAADKIPGDDIELFPQDNADAGGDETGVTGAKTGRGKE